MSQLENVRTGYDRWASVYDTDGNPMQALEGPAMRRAVQGVRGLKVLDLGCGTGRHSVWLADSGATVTALDFSVGMLDVASSKTGTENVTFVEHDLNVPLDLPDAEFDVVISGLVIEHLAELNLFVSEIYRLIKPGGQSVVTAMHPAMFLRDSQAQFVDPETGDSIRPGSLPHTLGAMVMAAGRAGLTLIEIEEIAAEKKFASEYGMRESSIGWSMLVVMQLGRPS